VYQIVRQPAAGDCLAEEAPGRARARGIERQLLDETPAAADAGLRKPARADARLGEPGASGPGRCERRLRPASSRIGEDVAACAGQP